MFVFETLHDAHIGIANQGDLVNQHGKFDNIGVSIRVNCSITRAQRLVVVLEESLERDGLGLRVFDFQILENSFYFLILIEAVFNNTGQPR